ncbi:glycoside hydrolase family 3 C-terminal domain-containing protein [Pseudomaricurvus alkylphenolicus]|uniref:glycoside hydrolase family 3 C-terminal domain-containing protein n=1 Tax=Pseudomaricurvus alkylphenolicus TaxID=1306991 RepID=UPI00197F0772|nr:glycoside hydrolase family 3 C-terminal domain-containing protein [Pseudomaricurvus alkylphenolicus]
MAVTQMTHAEVSEEKIERLLSAMTLEEKASLTSGASMWTTKPIERLQVPSITMTDGPHGVRKSRSGQFGDAEPATCYPPAVTLASTWNTELAHEVGVALGKESQAQDVQILLGPGTNIKRSPLGGRNFEYFSEDPILSGKFSSAYIQGVQSQGVGVSLKHYAVNDQEHERMTISAEVSPRALHEIYLRPFEMAVREAQPTTLMSAYNRINGTYASNSEYLLNDVLREQWGFEGMVITDWGAVDDRIQGIRARLHLQMPADGGINDRKIVEAVNRGELPESELNDVVRDLLKITLDLEEASGRYQGYDQDEHHELAYRVASEGTVLLKNNNAILPLTKRDKVAVVGNFAKVPRYQGAGSSLVTPTRVDNLIDHLDASFAPGYDLMGRTTPELIEQARQQAKSADKVVVVLGLTFLEESEGFDRRTYGIAPGHRALLEEMIAVNPNIVVVLQNGSPVSMPWLDRVDGVVEAYLGGQAGGRALADILTGKVNPSGKLAETFPKRIEDNPTYIAWAGEEGKTYYNEGVFVGYRYYDKKRIEPQFPFGYGLSYSTFTFEDLILSQEQITEEEQVTVGVTVKNTGKVAGHEVVQLYVSDEASSVGRPEKELKHFKKVFLQPGEEKQVTFELSNRDFAFYSARHKEWVTESGKFSIRVGNSSRHLPLEDHLSLNVIDPPKARFTRYSLVKEVQTHPIGMKIIDDMIRNLAGDFVKKSPSNSEKTELSGVQEVQNMKVGLTMKALILDMPIKNIVQFSKGQVSEDDLNQILAVLNQ